MCQQLVDERAEQCLITQKDNVCTFWMKTVQMCNHTLPRLQPEPEPEFIWNSTQFPYGVSFAW